MSGVLAVLLGTVVVGVGSGLGALARWGLQEGGRYLDARRGAPRGEDRVGPWATFTANVLASFLLGMVVTQFGAAGGALEFVFLLLSAGLCGGLSTLSTAAQDVVDMVRRGTTAISLGYLLLSIGVCMAALWLGVVIGT